MAKKSQPVEHVAVTTQQSIHDVVSEGYRLASQYFAEYRLISFIYDGLKPVYRRVISTAYEICRDKFVKSATLSGATMRIHPHGNSSIDSTINELVNAGILIGDGEFGSKYLDGTVAPAAAARYTSVKLNPVYKDIFDKILKYIPKVDAEVEGKEYKYVPLPLPYALIRGSFALGPGLSTRIPAFTTESMLKAIKADDYTQLESTYGYELVKKDKGLNQIWKTGNGKIFYQLEVGQLTLDGTFGYYITGSAEVFFLDMSVLNDWRANGWIAINEIGKGISKLFVSRNKGVVQISDSDILAELNRIKVKADNIAIKVIATDGIVHPIGLATWIREIYTNFISLVSQYKADKVNDIKYRIKLMNDFDVIKNYIIAHMKDPKCTPEIIAKATGKDLEIVKDIDSWSVNKLRTTVAADEIKKLNAELKEAQKFDCTKYADDMIVKLNQVTP